MNRRSFLGAVGGVGGVLGAAAIQSPALGARSTIEGSVEAKSVTGTKADTSAGILLAQEGDLSVEDPSYDDAVETWEHVAVDDDLAQRLRFDYLTIRYNVHVSHESPNDRFDVATGESLAYRADREQFNAVDVGDDVAFRQAGGDVPAISAFAEPDE